MFIEKKNSSLRIPRFQMLILAFRIIPTYLYNRTILTEIIFSCSIFHFFKNPLTWPLQLLSMELQPPPDAEIQCQT